MGLRRKARESALQILFEREFNDIELEKILARYWRDKKASPPVQEYAEWLVKGIVSRQSEVDDLIQKTSEHWRISRMAFVDRNILRMAAFELLHEGNLAPAIVINEAIEIAKKYSSDEAAVFVNGILDALRKRLESQGAEKKAKDNERKEEPTKKRRNSSGRRLKKK